MTENNDNAETLSTKTVFWSNGSILFQEEKSSSSPNVLTTAICLEQNRKVVQKDVEKIRDRIRNVDSKIIDLLYERSLMMRDVSDKIASICGSKYYLGASFEEIEDEYNKRKFESQIVKNAVFAVRRLFFDDRDKNFQKFDCTHIEFNHVYGRSYFKRMRFISFQFDDGIDDFAILIPCSIEHNRGNPFVENRGDGGVSIAIWVNDYYLKTLVSSLDFSEIRTFLRTLVSDIDAFRKKECKECEDEYNEYNIANGINHTVRICEDETSLPLIERIQHEFGEHCFNDIH